MRAGMIKPKKPSLALVKSTLRRLTPDRLALVAGGEAALAGKETLDDPFIRRTR
jgi:hypothetical protein